MAAIGNGTSKLAGGLRAHILALWYAVSHAEAKRFSG